MYAKIIKYFFSNYSMNTKSWSQEQLNSHYKVYFINNNKKTHNITVSWDVISFCSWIFSEAFTTMQLPA